MLQLFSPSIITINVLCNASQKEVHLQQRRERKESKRENEGEHGKKLNKNKEENKTKRLLEAVCIFI